MTQAGGLAHGPPPEIFKIKTLNSSKTQTGPGGGHYDATVAKVGDSTIIVNSQSC